MSNTPSKSAGMSPAQVNAAVIQAIMTSPKVQLRTTSLGVQNPVQSASAPVKVTFQPNKTGFIKGFLVKVKGTATNSSTSAAAAANDSPTLSVLSHINYVNFNATTRHDTTLRELYNLVSNRGFRMGANADDLAGIFAPQASIVEPLPDSIAEGASADFEFWFYVPIVSLISNRLMGIQWAEYEKAQASLSFVIPAAADMVGKDAFTAAYKTGTVALSDLEIEVFQQYWTGQLPQTSTGAIVIPPQSSALQYQILSGAANINLNPNQLSRDFLDQPYSYLSYSLLYDNGGVFNPPTGADRDLTTIGLYVDTVTPIYELPPAALIGFGMSGSQLGAVQNGNYFLDFAKRVINASSAGQYNIGIKPSSVASGAYVRRTLEVYGAA